MMFNFGSREEHMKFHEEQEAKFKERVANIERMAETIVTQLQDSAPADDILPILRRAFITESIRLYSNAPELEGKSLMEFVDSITELFQEAIYGYVGIEILQKIQNE